LFFLDSQEQFVLISKSDIETDIEYLINEVPKPGKGKITVAVAKI